MSIYGQDDADRAWQTEPGVYGLEVLEGERLAGFRQTVESVNTIVRCVII